MWNGAYAKSWSEENSQLHPCIQQHSCGKKKEDKSLASWGLDYGQINFLKREQGTMGTKIIFWEFVLLTLEWQQVKNTPEGQSN